jgi:hypothetical protein
VEHVPNKQTNLEVGAEQVKRLCQASGSRDRGLGIVSTDAKFGNHHFLDQLKEPPYGVMVRLKKIWCSTNQPQNRRLENEDGLENMVHSSPSKSQQHGENQINNTSAFTLGLR